MTMNRRQFLKNMGIGAAGAALPGVSMFAANEAISLFGACCDFFM